MRKSKQEADQTRQRIVSVAAAEFRKNGIVASGLNELMAAAGLTRGGFYKHFKSKNQLVGEACMEACRQVISERLGSAASRGSDPVVEYLSATHRDHPEQGCPLSAVGAELARCDKQTRSVASDAFLQLVEIVAKSARAGDPVASRQQAIVAVSTMIGAMTLSRVVNDPQLSSEILDSAKCCLRGDKN